VVSVADGDTLTVLESNKVQHMILVAGIDALEKGQPFWTSSRLVLKSNGNVRVRWNRTERSIEGCELRCARHN
jgi:endonuclease YncB( thermonuclease family)